MIMGVFLPVSNFRLELVFLVVKNTAFGGVVIACVVVERSSVDIG